MRDYSTRVFYFVFGLFVVVLYGYFHFIHRAVVQTRKTGFVRDQYTSVGDDCAKHLTHLLPVYYNNTGFR